VSQTEEHVRTETEKPRTTADATAAGVIMQGYDDDPPLWFIGIDNDPHVNPWKPAATGGGFVASSQPIAPLAPPAPTMPQPPVPPITPTFDQTKGKSPKGGRK
jgi:hypothetical protein